MNTIIERIKGHKILSALMAIVLGVVIFKLSLMLAIPVNGFLENYFELSFYKRNISIKFFMLVLSILSMLLINKGSLKGFGFSKPLNINYFKLLWTSLLFIIGTIIIGNLFFNVLMRSLFQSELVVKSFPEITSIWEMVFIVGIWSSISEEVLTRGLVQGFLNKHVNLKFLKLSLPVWVSGLIFGAMHIMAALTMDPFMGGFIIFNTTIIGLYMARSREKTQSIYPAMFIHVLTNLFSVMLYLIMQSMT